MWCFRPKIVWIETWRKSGGKSAKLAGRAPPVQNHGNRAVFPLSPMDWMRARGDGGSFFCLYLVLLRWSSLSLCPLSLGGKKSTFGWKCFGNVSFPKLSDSSCARAAVAAAAAPCRLFRRNLCLLVFGYLKKILLLRVLFIFPWEKPWVGVGDQRLHGAPSLRCASLTARTLMDVNKGDLWRHESGRTPVRGRSSWENRWVVTPVRVCICSNGRNDDAPHVVSGKRGFHCHLEGNIPEFLLFVGAKTQSGSQMESLTLFWFIFYDLVSAEWQ